MVQCWTDAEESDGLRARSRVWATKESGFSLLHLYLEFGLTFVDCIYVEVKRVMKDFR